VLRVPLLWRWPKGLPAGITCDAAIEHVDVVPTLLELADLPAAEGLHGASRAQALSDGAGEDEDDESYAVYSGSGRFFFSVRAYRRGSWQYVYAPHGGHEMYNLASDPEERVNLVADETCAAARRELRAQMVEAMRRRGDPLAGMAAGDFAE
jgi:arylsulfatase A-like enzyme